MNRTTLWIILLVALVLRLAVLLAGQARQGQLLTPDSRDYLALARSLAETGQFTVGDQAGPEIARTPGYPLLLAGLMRATRQTEVTPRLLAAVGMAQIILELVTIMLVCLMARRLAEPGVGLLAAGLYTISPLTIGGAVRVLSEPLFTALLAGAVFCLAICLKERRQMLVAPAGLLLAAACYVRPIALLLPTAAALVLLAQRQWRPAIALMLVFLAGALPWMARNYRAAGYMGFSTISAVNLHEYEAVAVQAKLTGRTEDQVRAEFRQRLDERFGLSRSASRYQWQSSQGWQIVSAHPALAIGLHLKSDLHSLLPGASELLEVLNLSAGQRGTLAVLSRHGLWAATKHYFAGASVLAIALAALGILLLLGLYAGILLAAIRYPRPHMPAWAWLIILFTLALLLPPGPASHPRFRGPAMPMLCLASAAGWMWVLGRMRKQKEISNIQH